MTLRKWAYRLRIFNVVVPGCSVIAFGRVYVRYVPMFPADGFIKFISEFKKSDVCLFHFFIHSGSFWIVVGNVRSNFNKAVIYRLQLKAEPIMQFKGKSFFLAHTNLLNSV